MSVEHRTGALLYKFDMSLMERLSTAGFPMSQIDVQRRMRPEISELVRFVFKLILPYVQVVKRVRELDYHCIQPCRIMNLSRTTFLCKVSQRTSSSLPTNTKRMVERMTRSANSIPMR